MKLVNCSYDNYALDILNIFNHAIANSTALYDYKPRTLENIKTWFENKAQLQFPVIGAIDGANQFLGFATYGAFRAGAGFRYSVEHSVYLNPEHVGKGVGKQLMIELIRMAKANGIHNLVGIIDFDNVASIALHEKLGFERVGIIKQAGYKFGQWRDCLYYQLLLETPSQPDETQ